MHVQKLEVCPAQRFRCDPSLNPPSLTSRHVLRRQKLLDLPLPALAGLWVATLTVSGLCRRGA